MKYNYQTYSDFCNVFYYNINVYTYTVFNSTQYTPEACSYYANANAISRRQPIIATSPARYVRRAVEDKTRDGRPYPMSPLIWLRRQQTAEHRHSERRDSFPHRNKRVKSHPRSRA